MKRVLVFLVAMLYANTACLAQVQQTTATLSNQNVFTSPNQFTVSVQTPLITNSTDSINLTSTNLALQFNNSVTSTGSIALSSTSLGSAVSISDNSGNSLFLGSSGSRPWNINLTNLALTSGLINTTGTTSYIYGNPLNIGVNSTPSSLGSISNGFVISNSTTSLVGTLTLPGLSGTACLEQINGVVTSTGLACGSGGGVTGSGTANTLAMWANSSTIGNSHISETTVASQPQFNLAGPILSINSADISGQAYIQCAPSVCTNYFEILGTAGSPYNGGQIFLAGGNNGSSVSIYPGTSNPLIVGRGTSGNVAYVTFPGEAFAVLPTVVNGSVVYCNDCHENTDPCSTSGGTGSGDFAYKINGRWKCY